MIVEHEAAHVLAPVGRQIGTIVKYVQPLDVQLVHECKTFGQADDPRHLGGGRAVIADVEDYAFEDYLNLQGLIKTKIN